jgi:spermidine synthase
LRLSPLTLTPLQGALEYFSVGRSTTVLLLETQGRWWLTNNGLPEAAIAGRATPPSVDRTVQWMALLPALARAELRSMLVIGFGGGLLLEWIPPSVEHVDVIELEPEVIAANARVSDRRRQDPLADPRVHVILNDARNALALSRRRYDAIVSQPSHPWTAGASHLYTREFFELVKGRLAPGGVFLQWIGPAYVDRELLRILVATLTDVFSSVRVYEPGPSQGILLLSSDEPLALERDAARVLERDAAWYRGAALLTPEDVAAALLLDEAGARRFSEGAPRNRDRRNHLQMRSPLLRLANKPLLDGERLVLDLGEPAATLELDPTRRLRALLELRFFDRARRALRESRDPAWRQLGSALLAEQVASPGQAAAAYRRVLEQQPDLAEARAGLIRVLGARAAGDGQLPHPGGDAAEALLLRGLAAEADRDYGELEALDASLGALGPDHLLHGQAVRLRARWRVQSGDPARGREAIVLLDDLRRSSERPVVLLERARAGARAGEAAVTLASLEDWLIAPGRARLHAEGDARALLRDLAVPDPLRPWAEDLALRLEPRGTPGG